MNQHIHEQGYVNVAMPQDITHHRPRWCTPGGGRLFQTTVVFIPSNWSGLGIESNCRIYEALEIEFSGLKNSTSVPKPCTVINISTGD